MTLAALACTAMPEASARVCTAVSSGNWATASTWSCGTVPAAGDTLNIPASRTVTINSNLSYTGTKMRANVLGTLAFDGAGAKLSMPCGSEVWVYAGGSVTANSSGSSQTIRICNSTYWSASDGNRSGPIVWPINWLPVELVAFEAQADGERIEVTWSTGSETSSSHFALLRSSDAQQWGPMAVLPAAGNSHALLSYRWADARPLSGLSYYQLIQCDTDGSCEQKGIVSAWWGSGPARPTVVPNPAEGDRAWLQLGEEAGRTVLLEVFTSDGALQDQQRTGLISDGRLPIQLAGLAPGIYHVVATLATGERRAAQLLLAR